MCRQPSFLVAKITFGHWCQAPLYVHDNIRVLLVRLCMMTSTTDQQSLQDEIADLERRLQDARSRLDPSNAVYTASVPAGNEGLSSHPALQ
jgi:hypothetical protein